jgi:hypothetical protein
VTSSAVGASPHFKKGGTPTCSDTGTQLVCTGSLAGLGNETVFIDLSADAQGTFACVNPGGNESPGQNKVPFKVASTTVIPSSDIKNGNLTFRAAAPLTPPTATAEQAGCPNPNWSTRLTNLEFSNVRLVISQGPTKETATVLFTCTSPGAVPESGSVTLSCS